MQVFGSSAAFPTDSCVTVDGSEQFAHICRIGDGAQMLSLNGSDGSFQIDGDISPSSTCCNPVAHHLTDDLAEPVRSFEMAVTLYRANDLQRIYWLLLADGAGA